MCITRTHLVINIIFVIGFESLTEFQVKPKNMQIFVNCTSSHLVEVGSDATVETVKAFLLQTEGIEENRLAPLNVPGVAPCDQYVMCQGRALESGSLLALGVSELSTLEVGVRVLGGLFQKIRLFVFAISSKG